MEQISDGKVVIVDDDPGVRGSLGAIIEAYGSRVHAFDNGSAALAFLSEQHAEVDVIITDISMPGMGGMDLLNRVRAINAEIPVILMTGLADMDLLLTAIKNEAFDFIIKPYKADYVVKAIKKAITYRRLHMYEKNYRADLEEALRDQARELAKVNEIALHNEKMALVGQIAAGVTHEINNPVGFISSNLGSLEKYTSRLLDFIRVQDESLGRYCPPEELERIAGVRKNVRFDKIAADIPNLLEETQEGLARIKEIVANLKSFSRTENDEFVQSNINEIIGKSLDIVRNEIKYVATVVTEYGDLLSIKCLPNQLSQVVMNLLINAAHAIQDQGVITIRSWQEGDNIFVAISDTGCGIPAEIRKRIFEPFFTTKEVGKGTGLGLSISYDIICKHGGEITVQSEAGRGTTFTIRLPLAGSAPPGSR
ncbi:MAG: response regulator [Desulfobacteraceae bacterium]|nr:response regulator [Desulfobacteraceae bacterium]